MSVEAAAPPAQVSVWQSARRAVSSTSDAFGRFVLANLLWTVVVAVPALAGTAYPPAYAMVVLLVPVSCGLMRMAGHAARDDVVAVHQLRSGMRYRLWRHLGLAAAQAAVLGTALLNIGTGLAGEGLLAAMIVVVAAYVALVSFVAAVVVWPILLDPRRSDVPLRQGVRLALAVLAARPLALLVLALLVALLMVATVQTVILGLLLPGLAALVASHLVLPTADRLDAA